MHKNDMKYHFYTLNFIAFTPIYTNIIIKFIPNDTINKSYLYCNYKLFIVFNYIKYINVVDWFIN